MARLTSSSPSPPPTAFRRRTKACARKCERACCAVATYFPLAFIYSLTTWAVWVEAGIGLMPEGLDKKSQLALAKPISILGILLYLLLNSCYTVAVFTDPGSPLQKAPSGSTANYSSLPTTEPSSGHQDINNITVSSTGNARYCKKCHTPKPDRAHHCSTCRRCVLKMDHHCPWLATCLGIHNYKAFVLFLMYTSIFCWICFVSSSRSVWFEVFEQVQYGEEFASVNLILLAVISGIIGLVLTGFTSWHLYLCIRGQTTIECLEKTRYLSGVRQQVERQRQDQLHGHRSSGSHTMVETIQRAGEQIFEFHANAVPGASRFEEGEEHTSPAPSTRGVLESSTRSHQRSRPSSQTQYADSPAQQALRRTYSSVEEQRDRDRYRDYLDEKESEKMPNAFDLGWKRNLSHLFGPKPIFWFLPICNTTGDGWRWEVSQKWVQANEDAAKRREQWMKASEHALNGHMNDYGNDGTDEHDVESGHVMSMQTLKRPGHAWGRARQRRDFDQTEEGELDQFEVSSDEDTDEAWDDRRIGERDR